MSGLMFNHLEVYHFINKFRLPYVNLNPRCHSREELAGTYVHEETKPQYYELKDCEEYDWENFRVPMGEEESINAYLKSLNGDVRKHVLKEAKLYEEMQWSEIKRRADLKHLYHKSADKNLQYVYGYRFRQQSFADFVREHLDEERKKKFEMDVERIIDDSIHYFVQTQMNKRKKVYDKQQDERNERIAHARKRRKYGMNFDARLLKEVEKEEAEMDDTDETESNLTVSEEE